MFRPDLLGHGPIRERLLRQLQEGSLAPTLLFVGPEGIGKRRVAMELAQRELCFRKTACGACAGCEPFMGEELPLEMPNLLRIAPAGKAGIIGIKQIREDDLVEGGVVQWAHKGTAPELHRWILVEEAHRLNGASANMLLKTLEEPPKGTRFLLVTHRPEAVLQTIRSRATRVAFGPLSPEDAWEVAAKGGWEQGQKARWTALSEGSLRWLEPQAYERAEAQLEAWMAILGGARFEAEAGPLLPDPKSDQGQAEQLRQPLELLLRLLNELGRLRAGLEGSLGPWSDRLTPLAASSLDLKASQDAIFEALQNLVRNLSAEPLLRGVALALRPV